jgi:hypothetical protein
MSGRWLVLALLFAVTPARAERPATSAIAAADNLIEDLIEKRWPAAVSALAPQVAIRTINFRDACKKSFGKPTAMRSQQLAKCLAANVPWPKYRLAGTETPIKDGWRVSFGDDVSCLVRKRKGGGFEVYDIAVAGLSRR